MTAAEKTKQQFAAALRQLLKKKSFSEIRVADLCKKLDCQRATFYYHFKDKYDLAAWIYVSSQEKIFAGDHTKFSMEACVRAAGELKADAAFYKKTLSDDAQTGLYMYAIEYYSELFARVIKSRNNLATLDKDTLYSIHYAAYAGLFMTREWLFGQNDLTAEEAVSYMIKNMPQELKDKLFDM